jgi:hypothetical protein
MVKKEIKYLLAIIFIFNIQYLKAQYGYYNAPYIRYEADKGILANGAASTPRSYNQALLQSEASEQVCVSMSANNASVQWTLLAEADGLVVRYSVPDGQSGNLRVYANNVQVGTLHLSSYYSWEYLSTNGNPNNNGVSNAHPKMRFDEVRMKLPAKIPQGGTIRLERQDGNIHLDFAELESIPVAVAASPGDVVYTGNGSNLQEFIDVNGGRTIYLPEGKYDVNRDLYFGVANTTLKGAGMWYTQIHFTHNNGWGGLRGDAARISYEGLYLTTVRNSRSNSYKAIHGIYTNTTIRNVWAEHFECGAWIANYGGNGPAYADGLLVEHCRFRNNYADGINLCKGTRNSVVQYCSFRNNGDDDMAIWSADGLECRDNTFRFNTSENCWRASGCAIYGGYNNKAHNLLIRDNLEVALRVNNTFPGAGFNTGGMHEFYNISIVRCGTNHDLYNSKVGAIDIVCTDRNGDRLRNIRFANISIEDSKNDAIYINRQSGHGFENLQFENIAVNGTGREYPDNGGTGSARGFGLLIEGYPGGYGTYCNMTYTNRGGNAAVDVNTNQIGGFSWTQAATCQTTVLTSPLTFGICDNPVVFTANAAAPAGNTITSVEFLLNAVSIGSGNTAPYSIIWDAPEVGEFELSAVAHYSAAPSSYSAVQRLTLAEGIYAISTTPVIDGVAEVAWSSHVALPIEQLRQGTINGAMDLSATFRASRDVDYLYLFVDVVDDVLYNGGGNDHWQNDGLELFIDMGNDKTTSYGPNDSHYNFVYNDPTVYVTGAGSTNGVLFQQVSTATGYTMEIAIPWNSLGGAQASNSFIGFDLHVNDNDNTGSGRKGKKAWKGDAGDRAWQDPSVLGTLQIAGCINPLPVHLLDFSGEKYNEVILLNWATASENNNDRFEIERSLNLDHWEKIGEVSGAGTSNTMLNYSFTDDEPKNGLTYYRLRQIDFDEAYIHSPVVSVLFDVHTLIIKPNPFEYSLLLEASVRGELEILIHDVLGRLLYRVELINEDGQVSIDPELSSGVYIITVRGENYKAQKKIIKN